MLASVAMADITSLEGTTGSLCCPGAPELLHAMSLKMHTRMWLETGRGFNGVLGGLLGFPSAHPHASDMLRTVRASCVRDVCAHDSTRGMELVRAIQVRPC